MYTLKNAVLQAWYGFRLMSKYRGVADCLLYQVRIQRSLSPGNDTTGTGTTIKLHIQMRQNAPFMLWAEED